ncbi:hypothetical protein [Bacillus horti]|uniref:Uncharacterized protein n=1 Tax=Caldalkalibacillus horti TaxID=77523 RepID=A0ABT9W3F6_9BACI|nr:hypothetical protein [Bacillus horti]MDQ0167786.1 hypothetical protein [Bacillus horti]
MDTRWSRIIMIILGFVALLIPGVRRFVFYRLLGNRFIRNTGLKLILATPFLRQRMIARIFPAQEDQTEPST